MGTYVEVPLDSVGDTELRADEIPCGNLESLFENDVRKYKNNSIQKKERHIRWWATCTQSCNIRLKKEPT